MLLKIQVQKDDLQSETLSVRTDDLLITEQRLVAMLPVSIGTLRKWRERGEFTGIYLGAKEGYRLKPALRRAQELIKLGAKEAEERARLQAARWLGGNNDV
jgi:hypothetical protein